MADDTQHIPNTDRITMIAAEAASKQIVRQTELCTVRLDAIRTHQSEINGDVKELSKTVARLADQLAQFQLTMQTELSTELSKVCLEIERLKGQRRIWQVIERVVLVVIAVASLVIAIWK